MNRTGIEYADYTLNPVKGCKKVSPGCDQCFAERMSVRLGRNKTLPITTSGPYAQVIAPGPNGKWGWKGNAVWDDRVIPDAIPKLVRLKKPSVIFVGDMADLFHPDVPDERIYEALALAVHFPQHTFLILTKRAARMAEILSQRESLLRRLLGEAALRIARKPGKQRGLAIHGGRAFDLLDGAGPWPLPNLWPGVTAENRDAVWMLDRFEHLQECVAAVRWISLEPLIGPVDFCEVSLDVIPEGFSWVIGQEIHWVVAGCETGSGARPAHPDWFRSVRDQCRAAGVPFFLKKLDAKGNRLLDGRTWDQVPGRLV